jgi:hypothetical protein
VQALAVFRDEEALFDAGGRRSDLPVGKEDEMVDPHGAPGQEERGDRERGPAGRRGAGPPHARDDRRRGGAWQGMAC